MMHLEIIEPVVGAFQSEVAGWKHAEEIANGREVRLVQSRQVDVQEEDLADSAYRPPPTNRWLVIALLAIAVATLVYVIKRNPL